jgi:hypothetical protein
MADLSPAHLEELRGAKRVLEHPGIAMRLTNMIGSPLEAGLAYLPADWRARIVGVTRRSLATALDVALLTMGSSVPVPTGDLFHKVAVSVTGGLGGAFGLASLAIELPISTTIMLRSIADVARGQGENLADPATKMACVEVFALGGRSPRDDAAESSYFAIRAALGQVVTEAAQHIATKAGAKSAAPPLVRLVTEVASRFGVVVSEKAAAQAVPIVGAGGGVLVNNLFMDHFQNMARGHFTVRRLERAYGAEAVERAYRSMRT